MHCSSLELGRERVELNVCESFKYFPQELLRKYLEKNICYFKSPISPWRGPQWKSLIEHLYTNIINNFQGLTVESRAVSDDTKILTETGTKTFFQYQISETETNFKTFFRDQFFSETETFSDTKFFRNQDFFLRPDCPKPKLKHSKFCKSLETET